MPRLFNATTGLLEDVESPEESYLSGTHGILKTETANLVSPDSGDVFKIPQPEVEGLLRTGFTFEGEDAALTRKIRNEVKGEGFYGGLKKFVKEAADEALTLGTSEAFLDAKQDPKSEAYKRRQAEEEAHPIANIAGGLTGGAISLLYGGPIWKGMGWAGTKAAQGALKAATVLGTSKAAQLTGKALAGAAKFGTEGALAVAPRSAGEAAGEILREQGKLSEEALGDPEVVAEALAGFGEDLLEGAVLGAGLGVGAKAIGSGISKAAQFAGGLATKENLNRWGNTMYLKGRNFTTMSEQEKVAEAAISAGLASDIEEGANIAVQLLKREGFEGSGMLGEGAYKNLKRAKSVVARLGNTLGAIRKKASEINPTAVNVGLGIRRMDEALQALVANGGKGTPDYKALQDVQSVLLNYVRASQPGAEKWGRKTIDKVMDTIGIDFLQAAKIKKSMDSLASKTQGEFMYNTQGLRDGVRIWTDVADDALNQVMSSSTKDFSKMFKQLKGEWGFFRNTLGKLPVGKGVKGNLWAKAAARLTGNNFISVRDTAAGLAGGVAAGAPGAIASVLATQTLRKYGPQMSSQVLFGMARNVDKIQDRIYGAVDGALGIANKIKARPTSKAVLPLSVNLLQRYSGEKDKIKAYRTFQRDIQKIAADPQIGIEAVSGLTEPFSFAAPQVAQMFGSKVTQGLAYLQNEMPKGRDVPSALNPNPYVPTDRELSQFERKMAVVFDPLTVLDELAQGTVTKEQLDALKQVYPRLYEIAQQRVARQLAAVGSKIPYHKRLHLSRLLEMPIPSAEPSRVKGLQDNFAAKQKGPAPSGKNRMEFDASVGTEIDRVLHQ